MKVIIEMIKNISILLISGLFIMLFEGNIARSHHLYTIGYGETLLALMIIGNVVGYATNSVLSMLESR